MTHNIEKQNVRPRFINPQGDDIEPIVMRAEYQLPWDRQSNQTACGTTIQVQGGDKGWRVIIEGVISASQLRTINSDLRGLAEVEVITAELGKVTAVFDQFNVTRVDEEEVGEIEDHFGPFLSFQIQTKEQEDQEQLFEDFGPDIGEGTGG